MGHEDIWEIMEYLHMKSQDTNKLNGSAQGRRCLDHPKLKKVPPARRPEEGETVLLGAGASRK